MRKDNLKLWSGGVCSILRTVLCGLFLNVLALPYTYAVTETSGSGIPLKYPDTQTISMERFFGSLSPDVPNIDHLIQEVMHIPHYSRQLSALRALREIDPLDITLLQSMEQILRVTHGVGKFEEVSDTLHRVTERTLVVSDAIFYYHDGGIALLAYYSDGEWMDDSAILSAHEDLFSRYLATGAHYRLIQPGSTESQVMVQFSTTAKELDQAECSHPIKASVRTSENRLPPAGIGLVTNLPVSYQHNERVLATDEMRQLTHVVKSGMQNLHLLKADMTPVEQRTLVTDLDNNGKDDVISIQAFDGEGKNNETVMRIYVTDITAGVVQQGSYIEPEYGQPFLSLEFRGHYDLNNDGSDEVLFYYQDIDRSNGIGLLMKVDTGWEWHYTGVDDDCS